MGRRKLFDSLERVQVYLEPAQVSWMKRVFPKRSASDVIRELIDRKMQEEKGERTRD